MTIWEITGNRNAPHSIIKLYINTLHQSIPFRRGSGPEGVRDLPRCLPERFNGVSHRSANGEAGEESIKKDEAMADRCLNCKSKKHGGTR